MQYMQLSVIHKDPIIQRLISLVPKLLLALPTQKCTSEKDEEKLKTRFLVPILQGLFDYHSASGSISVDFIGSNNPESTIDDSLSKRRPDGIITSNNTTIGYVEVKPLKELVDTYKTNKDLVRLGKFCKTAIDTYKLNTCFSVQAIGTHLVFYLVEYVNCHLYIMTELDQVHFTTSIEDLPMLQGLFDNLYRMLRIFEEKCIHNNYSRITTEENHSATLGSPLLSAVTTSTTSRSRVN